MAKRKSRKTKTRFRCSPNKQEKVVCKQNTPGQNYTCLRANTRLCEKIKVRAKRRVKYRKRRSSGLGSTLRTILKLKAAGLPTKFLKKTCTCMGCKLGFRCLKQGRMGFLKKMLFR